MICSASALLELQLAQLDIGGSQEFCKEYLTGTSPDRIIRIYTMSDQLLKSDEVGWTTESAEPATRSNPPKRKFTDVTNKEVR